MSTINKKIFTLTAGIAVLLAVFAGAALMAQTDTLAQTSGSAGAIPGSASGSTLAVPAGFTVIPPSDQDRSDDQILQLNNLTIQNLSGTVPGTIYASQDFGNTCRRYYSVEGGASAILPCPLAPSILYQIQLQPDTILLLKDRSRASINDFAAGDRINVFGFLDPGTSYVQALIVRDLDKPAVAQYVQLNNLSVLSDPGSTVPASFRAARRGVEPCLSFMSGSGVTVPCPLGVQVSALTEPGAMSRPGVEALTEADMELYRPYREYYAIQVTAGTHIMDLNRQGLDLASIEPGDLINVYGRYLPGNRAVEAIILRDLSVPRSPVFVDAFHLVSPNGDESFMLSDTVAVRYDPGFRPTLEGYTFALSLIDGPTQGIIDTFSYADTRGTYRWTVDNVAIGGDALTQIVPGNYRLKIDLYNGSPCLSLCPVERPQPSIIDSDVSDRQFRISGSGDSPDGPVISSISPSSGPHSSRVTLRGEFAASGNYVYVGGYNAGNDLRSDGRILTFTIPEYVGVCPYNPYNLPKEPVACIAIALRLPFDEHRVYVVNANGTSNSVSFEIVPGGETVPQPQ